MGGREGAGAPFNFLPLGATDLVMPLAICDFILVVNINFYHF